MIKHFLTKQFLRFFLVGITSAFINYLSRIVINYWTSFVLAIILSYLIGMITAFLLNKIFVFPYSKQNLTLQIRNFCIVNTLNLFFVIAMSLLLRKAFALIGMNFYPADLAHLIALGFLTFSSFLIYKFFAFK